MVHSGKGDGHTCRCCGKTANLSGQTGRAYRDQRKEEMFVGLCVWGCAPYQTVQKGDENGQHKKPTDGLNCYWKSNCFFKNGVDRYLKNKQIIQIGSPELFCFVVFCPSNGHRFMQRIRHTLFFHALIHSNFSKFLFLLKMKEIFQKKFDPQVFCFCHTITKHTNTNTRTRKK